jgi:hypothetical protein
MDRPNLSWRCGGVTCRAYAAARRIITVVGVAFLYAACASCFGEHSWCIAQQSVCRQEACSHG